jgi:hypothetical protein
MRWGVATGTGDPTLIRALIETRDLQVNAFWRDVDLDEEFICRGANSTRINLFQLETLWNLAIELNAAQLCSASLTAAIAEHPFAEWIYPRILEVHQPLFEEFRRRRSSESDFALQAETDRLDEQLVSSLRETHVVVPPHIAELVEQIFDHLHWLLVERFDRYVDFERDVTIASIWLGSGFKDYLHTGRPHGLRKP